MIPTPEMIEAARSVLCANGGARPLIPESYVKEALTAALALIPVEPIGWQLVPKELTTEMREALMMIRQELGSTLMDNADEIYSAFLSWAPKSSASPAPLPVAVKELADALELELKRLDDIPPSIQSQANIRLINAARALIRSSLSSPVGGAEGELKDDQLKTTVEICRSAAEDMIKANIPWRLDPRYILRLCDAVSSLPTPSSDIAALREENERLRNALAPFSKAAGDMFADNLNSSQRAAVTGSVDVSLIVNVGDFFAARSALQHVAKGERG